MAQKIIDATQAIIHGQPGEVVLGAYAIVMAAAWVNAPSYEPETLCGIFKGELQLMLERSRS